MSVPAKWESKQGEVIARRSSGRGRGTTLTARHSSQTHVTTGIDPRPMPSIPAPRRPPTKQLGPCPQPLSVSPIASPQPLRSGRALRDARIRPFSGLHSLPAPRSRQSSARHDFQSKSREPSFESKLGGGRGPFYPCPEFREMFSEIWGGSAFEDFFGKFGSPHTPQKVAESFAFRTRRTRSPILLPK